MVVLELGCLVWMVVVGLVVVGLGVVGYSGFCDVDNQEQ